MGFTRRWRDHRRTVRDERALARAIDEASTPAMRSELMVMAAGQLPHYGR